MARMGMWMLWDETGSYSIKNGGDETSWGDLLFAKLYNGNVANNVMMVRITSHSLVAWLRAQFWSRIEFLRFQMLINWWSPFIKFRFIIFLSVDYLKWALPIWKMLSGIERKLAVMKIQYHDLESCGRKKLIYLTIWDITTYVFLV